MKKFIRSPYFLFLCSFLIRTPTFNFHFLNIDELTNGIFASFILDHQLNLKDFLGNTYLLTHYLYVLVYFIFGKNNLLAIHVMNALWNASTSLVLYFCGKKLTNSHRGGLFAGYYHAFFSIAFFFFLGFIKNKSSKSLFFSGLFIGVSCLFKSPSGIIIVPLILAIIFYSEKPLGHSLIALLGLILTLSVPYLIQGDFYHSIKDGFYQIRGINKGYIQAYSEIPFTYWLIKYLIRTLLIFMAMLPVTYLAFRSVKIYFKDRISIPNYESIAHIYLFLWLLSMWFVVTLGKRIFYHYFIFIIPPLCLMAAITIGAKKISVKNILKSKTLFLVHLVGLASIIAFFSDGVLRWSVSHQTFPAAINYIKTYSKPHQPIFVWGLLPQIYYLSSRKPASTMIWADSLAGFSPGTPAMEYMRITGKKLTIPEEVLKDLAPYKENISKNDPITKNRISFLNENELLTIHEVLSRIDNPLWQKLFSDFFKTPPVIFIDTSTHGARGFSSYPLAHYELLKKFIIDNYHFIGIYDGLSFYQLNS